MLIYFDHFDYTFLFSLDVNVARPSMIYIYYNLPLVNFSFSILFFLTGETLKQMSVMHLIKIAKIMRVGLRASCWRWSEIADKQRIYISNGS